MGMKVKCLDPGSTSSDKIGLLGNLKPERGYPGGGSKKYTPSRDSEKDSGDESIVGARGGNPETEKDATTEKQQELIFHNDYGAVTNCTIDLKLRSFDLCNILCGKFGVKKDHNGTLVEHWVDKGLERIIEDHEDVLSVWRQTEKGAKKLIFRKNPLRYAIFVSPEDYFPSDMVDLGRDIESPTPPEVLVYTNDCPLIFSQVDLRKEFDKTIWVRTFLVLKNRQLLMSLNVHAVSTFLKQWKTRKIRYTPLDEPDPNKDKDDSCLHFLADLKDYEIYNCLNAKNQLRAPTEFGICLRRTSEDDFASSIVFSCDNSDDRTCWLAAMRLSKYGKQLKQNYKEFREKSRAIYDEEMRRMGSSSGKAGQSESRVAMDFTGATGRIVEDQLEAEEIAVADASGSGGRHRMRSTAAAAAVAAVVASAVTSGSATYSSDFELIDKKHANKPWYHKNMSREQASRALLDFSTEDGTFVVRDSRSQPGCHVLSIRLHDKIVHVRVYPMIDSVTWDSCYSLDNGHTKFQCLVKLVEFYRLNQGSLPCRLTYHLEKVPEESTDV